VKFLTAQFASLRESGTSRRNLRLLGRFLLLLAALVTTHGVIFHLLMAYEGQEHSWVSGFYWVFVVMSTLGFGDITFQSDIGRVFSVVVLMSGVLFLLVMLPFTFVEFFYSPWLDAQRGACALCPGPGDTP
jgi:voltage-gated potassium channel